MKRRDVYIICALLYMICILSATIMVLRSIKEPQSEGTTEAAQIATEAKKEPETATERATATTERPTEIITTEPETEKKTDKPDPPGDIIVKGYGWVFLQYSATYHIMEGHLTRENGSIRCFGHRETWYSTHEECGQATAVDIPGKHIAEDGTIRDCDGYICVASSDLAFYSVVMTSVGPGKVYDCGCSSGTIDVYTNW